MLSGGLRNGDKASETGGGGPQGGGIASANPWREASLGAASQWLLGANWTSAGL